MEGEGECRTPCKKGEEIAQGDFPGNMLGQHVQGKYRDHFSPDHNKKSLKSLKNIFKQY